MKSQITTLSLIDEGVIQTFRTLIITSRSQENKPVCFCQEVMERKQTFCMNIAWSVPWLFYEWNRCKNL